MAQKRRLFTKPSFFFYPLQRVKPALRETEAEDNSQHDGARHLDGFHAVVGELRHIVHDEIVGRIVKYLLREPAGKYRRSGKRSPGFCGTADRIRENTVSAKVAIRFASTVPISPFKPIT